MRRYLSLVPIILLIAAILSVCIIDNLTSRDWLSFGLLFFLFNLTVWADYIGEKSATNAISALESLSPPQTYCKRNNQYLKILSRELVPGDLVKLKSGVVIPADGNVVETTTILQIDESSLTGESLPVSKMVGSTVLSGSVVQRGEGEIVIIATGVNSFFGKTIALLGKAQVPGHLRTILDSAAKIITLVAAIFAIFLFFWIIFHENLSPNVSNKGLFSLKSAFVLVAAVTPAAMPVVTTTVLAVGAKIMSKEQAIVNRLSAIEEAAGIEILCSDKTGTLTKNELSIYHDETICENGFTPQQLFLLASLASSYDEDVEPIDKVINNEINTNERSQYKIVKFNAFNPVDKRTEAIVTTPEGEKLIISKGAPHIIRDMVTENGKKKDFADSINKIINLKAQKGLRTLGVAYKAQETLSNWILCGYISMFDPPRNDTHQTIKRSMEMGIEVKMITGDQQAIAIETARQLGLGTNIVGPEIFSMNPSSALSTPFLSDSSFSDFIRQCNGFAGMYPEHKFSVVNALLKTGYLVGMTGDGVNDAPALKLATVGIAVAGATEAAKAAADIVLLNPGLSSIIKAFCLSRQIFKRIESYITFRIFTSVYILIFIWSSTVFLNFRFPSWTLVLISLINDFTLMSCAYDNVPIAESPLKWSMLKVTLIAVWMATITSVFTILFVIISDPSFGINWWEMWGVGSFVIPSVGSSIRISSQTNSAVWLMLTLLIQFSFHSCRTKRFFFMYDKKENKMPNNFILILQAASIIITFFLSIYWKEEWKFGTGNSMKGLNYGQALLTLALAIVFFLITDLAKLAAYNASKLQWGELNLFNLFSGYNQAEVKEKKRQKLQKLIAEELDKRFRDQTGSYNLLEKLENQSQTFNLAIQSYKTDFTSPPGPTDFSKSSIQNTNLDLSLELSHESMLQYLNQRINYLDKCIEQILKKVESLDKPVRNT